MQTKRKLKRYLIAVVMLVISSYATLQIKNAVDARTPEKSLPIISVSAGYNPPYVVRAGYTWKFGSKVVRSPYVDVTDVPLMITDCYPETNIVINFSAPYESLKVYQASGVAADDFEEITELITPKAEGKYVYKVEAEFSNGDILYYFAVQVKKGNLLS